MALSISLKTGFQRGSTGDPLSRFGLRDGLTRYTPLAVASADAGAAYRRDIDVRDFRLPDGDDNYTPLAVAEASNGIATRGQL